MFPIALANQPSVRNFEGPRINIVAVAVLVFPFLAGIFIAAVSRNPFWFLGGLLLGFRGRT